MHRDIKKQGKTGWSNLLQSDIFFLFKKKSENQKESALHVKCQSVSVSLLKCDYIIVCVRRCVCKFFCLNRSGCILQAKPVHPPCGTTMPGCISMTTLQKESLHFLSRTLSTPCSLMPVSSSCSGTQWKGGCDLCVWFHCLQQYCISAATMQNSSDMFTATFVSPSLLFRLQILQTDTFPVYRKQWPVVTDLLPFSQS